VHAERDEESKTYLIGCSWKTYASGRKEMKGSCVS